jgi:hypothetical protein
MKKSLLLLLIGMALSFFACGNQSGQAPNASPGASTGPSSAERSLDDVDIVVGANYYEEVKDDKGNVTLKYGGWLRSGSTALLLPGDLQRIKAPDGKGGLLDEQVSPARITSSANQNEVGKQVLISRYYILPQQRVGVIRAENAARVYSGTGAADVTTYVLPRYTVIGVAPLEQNAGGLKRQRFTAYRIPQESGDPLSSGVWGPLMVDPADVSMIPDDVAVAKIITVDMPKKDKSLWGDIVKNTETQYPNSIFLTDLRAMIGQAGGLAARATKPVQLKAKVKGESASVRTEPDEKVGSIIGNLDAGTELTISAQTIDSYPLGDAEAPWYKVKAGDLVGWVFGGDLDLESQ